jgi:hypothetical protein
LSVLWTGAPDRVRCTMPVQIRSSHSREFEGALRYNSPDRRCATRLSGVPAEQRLTRATIDSDMSYSEQKCRAEVRTGKSEGTGLSGATRGQSPNGRLGSEP